MSLNSIYEVDDMPGKEQAVYTYRRGFVMEPVTKIVAGEKSRIPRVELNLSRH